MAKGKTKQEILKKLNKGMKIVSDETEFVNNCLEKIED